MNDVEANSSQYRVRPFFFFLLNFGNSMKQQRMWKIEKLWYFSLFASSFPSGGFFLIRMNMHNVHESKYEMCLAMFRGNISSFFLQFEWMLHWLFALAFAIKSEFDSLGLCKMHFWSHAKRKYLIGLNYGSGTIKREKRQPNNKAKKQTAPKWTNSKQSESSSTFHKIKSNLTKLKWNFLLTNRTNELLYIHFISLIWKSKTCKHNYMIWATLMTVF